AEALEVCKRLQAAGLVQWGEGQLGLTEAGRHYALQVIRAHRLYETYLAQQTGHQAEAWHRRADAEEHKLSPEQVNALARQLGHPRYDPHGDPIPTADGRVVAREAVSLAKWPVGEPGRIVHIEDEPEAAYAELSAAGLCSGMDVRVTHSDAERVVVEYEGQRQSFSPMVASHVSVMASPAALPVEVQRALVPLSALKRGERGRVMTISPRCRGAERRRLLDLGIVPGTEIAVDLEGPLGDPRAYRVRQTLVALRREQADLILVVKEGYERRDV
ncbi:MAG: FeoA domain-containing protein, partial [Verrucomicrobiae bacterium]|nr:FeoA domain-containing protein [Verrucomicrobiae bacterium]